MTGRAKELAWIPDYLGPIRSDLSRFHRVDGDIEDMDSRTFFNFVEYLTAYDGALTAVLTREREEEKKRTPKAPGKSQGTDVPVSSILTMIDDGKQF